MIRCTGCRKFKTMQQSLFFFFVFFARADMSMLNLCSRHFNGLSVIDRFIFTIATLVFRCFLFVVFFVVVLFVFFYATLPPYLSPCFSVYTPSRTLRSSSDEKTLSGARRKVKGFVLCPGSPSLEQHSCSHPTLQFSFTVLKTVVFTSAYSELL